MGIAPAPSMQDFPFSGKTRVSRQFDNLDDLQKATDRCRIRKINWLGAE